MEKYEHGGNVSDEILYDFSANVNPLGLPENVKKALMENADDFSRYPDPRCRKLVGKISEYENISPEKIVCGNGAADLIYRLVYAFKPKKALLLAPTFSEYEKALSEVGCEIKYHMLNEKENFAVNESILSKLHDIDIFFICDPNNPTGSLIDKKLKEKIGEKCRKENILLVSDECFLGFTDHDREPFISGVTVKAFTKLYAMAGLRLGVMLFEDSFIARRVQSTGQCWSVSYPAQIAGAAALDEREYVKKSKELIKKEREYLYENLSVRGIKLYPSDANFILLFSEIPLYEKLKKERILVRSCENFMGLTEKFIRIAVRTHDENTALVNAVKQIVRGK